MSRVLIAGESWSTTSIHVKGFDSFVTVEYAEGVGFLRGALVSAGHEVTYQPAHVAASSFPWTIGELEAFDVVVLSDLGSNSLLISPETFRFGTRRPNRLAILRDWTRAGGGLAMVGGYMSFTGFEGKANYRNTPLAAVLPVEMEATDDRIESPEDGCPRLTGDPHPVTAGLPSEWPEILGYQRFAARAGATVLATVNGDPLLVVAGEGAGRALAFATDVGPHWAPRSFVDWVGFGQLWDQAIRWLSRS